MLPGLTEDQRIKLISRVLLNGESVTVVCQEAGISRTLFYRWLGRYKTLIDALKQKTKPKLSAKNRMEMIMRVQAGEPVTQIVKIYGISRTIFYRLLKRYNSAPISLKSESLSDKKPHIVRYYRQAPEKYEQAVLSAVIQYPHLSSHKLIDALPKIGGKPILGNHGIQNVLRRHNLTTIDQRLAYAQAVGHPVIVDSYIHLVKRIFSMLFSQSPQRRTHIVHFFTFFVFGTFLFISSIGLIYLTQSLTDHLTEFRLGHIFAMLSLSFGLLFFIYSMKYYLTIATVLSYTRRLAQDHEGIKQKGLLKRLFGIEIEISNSDGKLGINHAQSQSFPSDTDYKGKMGLYQDIAGIKLMREPFVSIHLSTFNEKRVIDRLLTAVTSLDYDKYEIIVADDSTDETFNKLRQWEKHPRVKILHRHSREGYKGGALKLALQKTDPRAEFVMVLDADFIPYPDTITQFLKYFQYTAGTLDFGASGISTDGKRISTNDSRESAINSRESSPIAAIQGYQWHVLNKSENFVTRGVRSEYAGSYVIERTGEEIYGGLKQLSGSVYMIRREVLEKIGWGTSLTEDLELTLKLYEAGYKVVYTPYIQAPAEAVGTLKRLIRQRMRWAEGHSFNIKRMFKRLMVGSWVDEQGQTVQDTNMVTLLNGYMVKNNNLAIQQFSNGEKRFFKPSPLTLAEKLELLYLAPYYLQAAFFIAGTLSWLIAETVFRVRLPFWTEVWGWSLVLTNLFALPLMNMVGLFMEESEERDYLGLLSFTLLTYTLAPFQAYAAIKGFLEKEEGPWFRTPKTGRITDVYTPGRFTRFFSGIFGRPAVAGISNQWKIENNYLASGTAYNTFDNFRIRKRHVRWIGNTVLLLLLIISLLLTNFTAYIPIAKKASAAQRRFHSLSEIGQQSVPLYIQDESSQVLDGPVMVRYPGENGKNLEYIFHPEPRTRTKYDGKEIDITLIGSVGLGTLNTTSAKGLHGKYIYKDIFENVDLIITAENNRLTEQIVLYKYQDFSSIDYSLKTDYLIHAMKDNAVYFAPEDGGSPLFTFMRPYMYEKNYPHKKNYGVKYVLEKQTLGGWKLQKVLTDEGKAWLADPGREYPVILDPTQITSPIHTAVTTAESDYGQQQRKIVWANGALNGDAWYAIYEDASSIFYEKCVPSVDGCETDTDWTDRTDIDGGDADNNNPSAWWENDQKRIWITWSDNSRDNLELKYLDVDASDPGTESALCFGADQANHNPTTWLVNIAIADSAGSTDDIFVTYIDTSTSAVNNIYRIDVASSIASSCTAGTEVTWTSILSGSGVDAGDRPLALALSSNLHLIFQDATTIRHSVYVNDASPAWDRADYDITAVVADNTSTNYSAATDGTDVWLIIDQGTTGVDLWTCASCGSGTTWTDAADPWGSQGTDITEVSLSYDSGTDDIVALALRGSGSTEEVVTTSTDTTSISWITEASLGVFGGGSSGLEDLSSVMSANSVDGVAFVLSDATNSELEFSTVPENIFILVILLPFLQKLFKNAKRGLRVVES